MIEAYPHSWPIGKARTSVTDRKEARFSSSDRKTQIRYDGSTYSYMVKKVLTVAVATERLFAEINSYSRAGHDWRIDPDDVIISTNIRLRLDGRPYSGQREPEDSGVAVYFKLDKIQYCFPCDKWDRVADNIAAIASHLGAMRGMERWGVGESHDVFTGFKALPASVTLSCWDVLGIKATKDIGLIKTQFRGKAFDAHPDHGGTQEAFTALQSAYEQAIIYANSK